MRDVAKIWDTWRSGRYVGDNRPSTRVTVEESFFLTPTDPVIGQWTRGPARWFQRADPAEQIETEVPGVLSVNISRTTESDAGTCDITIRNVTPPELSAPEVPDGQLADIGHYTPERGESQEAAARWGHAINAWHGVLVPNALVRTYQGFGGHTKPVRDAVADGDIVLNGVWLVDDVTIQADGTIQIKCRDMAKLLIDQQLVPPLVPQELYPLVYQRWRIEEYAIPADPPPGTDDTCPGGYYRAHDGGWSSSTDEYYGTFNAGNTGHPPSDAFDISTETAPLNVPGAIAHQRTYWLSEPKGSPNDTVWIEFEPDHPGYINTIYYHAWKGQLEGRGTHLVMVSVMENGAWVRPETNAGGITPQGVPYVSTFVPGVDAFPGDSTNMFPLPRDYFSSRIRLTVTNLLEADDFPYGYQDPDFHGGGYRGGARKIMACFSGRRAHYPAIVYAAGAIPVNTEDRAGYWQVKENGRIFAFGDARVYPPNGGMIHVAPVYALAVHPSGRGYWTLDGAGRVVAAGEAQWLGDGLNTGYLDFIDIDTTPDGNGYWLLRRNGEVYPYGNAVSLGSSSHFATMPDGVIANAQSLAAHPDHQGYWVLWQDGFVDAFSVDHYGHADRDGFAPLEWVTSIRATSTGAGYRILSGLGNVQTFGDAVDKGSVTNFQTSDRWFYDLAWDLIPSSSTDDGYLIQRASGNLSGLGTYNNFGSVGSGRGQLRYDGNYKDYSDIIRDLLLWAGFYLYTVPPPAGEQPDVYGNIETTGAYNTQDKLPQDMFDKRPVLDAIRDIKAIVGYLFYIDAEGAARFESPNWWQVGNFLVDGTPLSYMPEIDERVQLTGHNVVRSASSARSEIIISTEYPYATINGQKVPDGIVKTRIVGSTAADLKGIISPAIWYNNKFLRPAEQKTMAELIDMRIWFSRRTATVNCVANPLIDVNDQVRVIERQTGDVYVHYVKSVNFSHDLQTGSFTMQLGTHWLGGTPYGELRLFYAAVARPQGDGYWQIAANGDVYAYGAAELHERNEPDTHTSWPIAMRSTTSGRGYWTLDQNGKVLTYGDAVNYGSANRDAKDAIDLAITPSGNGYWILLLSGEVHTFGDAINYGSANVTGTLPTGAAVQARSIESHPATQGYWILLSDGHVQAFNLSSYGDATRDGFRRIEYVNRLRSTLSGNGYWIVSGSGIVQEFGDAAFHGSASPYPDDRWHQGVIWDFVVNSDGGYGLQRADGTFEMFGPFDDRGLVGNTMPMLNWALVTEDAYRELDDPTNAFPVSKSTIEFLKKTSSPSANNAVTSDFNSPSVAALEGSTIS